MHFVVCTIFSIWSLESKSSFAKGKTRTSAIERAKECDGQKARPLSKNGKMSQQKFEPNVHNQAKSSVFALIFAVHLRLQRRTFAVRYQNKQINDNHKQLLGSTDAFYHQRLFSTDGRPSQAAVGRKLGKHRP